MTRCPFHAAASRYLSGKRKHLRKLQLQLLNRKLQARNASTLTTLTAMVTSSSRAKSSGSSLSTASLCKLPLLLSPLLMLFQRHILPLLTKRFWRKRCSALFGSVRSSRRTPTITPCLQSPISFSPLAVFLVLTSVGPACIVSSLR